MGIIEERSSQKSRHSTARIAAGLSVGASVAEKYQNPSESPANFAGTPREMVDEGFNVG
jgi:hypothetical protein